MAEKDIMKLVTVENDKLFVSCTAKIGLENFSSVDINVGLTKVLSSNEDYLKVADEIFYQKILPKLEEYAKAMAEKMQPLIDVQKQIKINAQSTQVQTQQKSYGNYGGYNKSYNKNYGTSGYYKKNDGQ